MTDADALLRDGDLAGARKALVEIVRSRPSDEQARMFLFQLLAVAGEWDKAKSQLEALAQLSPQAQMLTVTYGQTIAAEALRARVFSGEEAITLLHDADGWAAGLPAAIQAFAKGDTAAGEAARDAAFDAAPDTPGTLNGIAFDWICDVDARFGPTFECILGGRYGLIPFSALERIESSGPADLRDIVWYPVQVAFRSGQSAAAFLPARYPGTEGSAVDLEKLARATSWQDASGGEIGSGQHLWSLSDGDDVGLLSLTVLKFDQE